MSTQPASKDTKPAYTPGPWRVGNQRLMIYGADDHLIARVYHNVQFKHARPGDPHLISAAPELYEALKAAIEILKIVDVDALGIGQGADGQTWPLLAEYLHGMRAAIQKAEGRS